MEPIMDGYDEIEERPTYDEVEERSVKLKPRPTPNYQRDDDGGSCCGTLLFALCLVVLVLLGV